ncbi:MAG: FecR domain-containing protein [Nitrospirae bacterium]|nr:FecR domain-containing protein [Nitrospirota bacterium]
MAHRGAPASVQVKVSDDVLFKAVIETQSASRSKALFLDDTLLTIGENSRVEITEQIYDPAGNRRSTVMSLVHGQVRALVGRVFEGAGSRFEIHTPSAVAAARGTHFVVWIADKTAPLQGGRAPEAEPHVLPVSMTSAELAQSAGAATGLMNVGESGNVDFTSGGKTVTVKPQEYSLALPGQPPSAPVPYGGNAPAHVTGAIVGTILRDMSKREAIREIVQALGTGGNRERLSTVLANTPPSVRDGVKRELLAEKAEHQAQEGAGASGGSQSSAADVSTFKALSSVVGQGGSPGGIPTLITPPAALSDALPEKISKLKQLVGQIRK